MIRPATIDDATAIAAINVGTWHTAYAGIIPEAYLSTVVLDDAKVERWRAWLQEPGAKGWFVAVDGEAVVGFAVGGPQRDADLPFSGELYAIYVLAVHQRGGLGTALVRAVAGDLQARGMSSMSVWVLELGPGCRFYERLGGRRLDKRIERDFAGTSLTEVAYGWPDTSILIRP